MKKKLNQGEGLTRLRESLVQELLNQSDEDILADAAADGINPDEARSRIVNTLLSAKASVSPRKVVAVLPIDADRARSILRRVAQRAPLDAPAPLLQAAELAAKKNDAEVLDVVAKLKRLGVVSDDEIEG